MKEVRKVIGGLGNLMFSGRRFGRWIVMSFAYRRETDKYHYYYWNCLCDCGQERAVEERSLRKGNSVSCGCYKRESALKGEDHYMWKGDSIGYHAVHAWLRKHYGKASKCENQDCPKTSSRYEWAKLPDKTHRRRRENYKQLCHKCHFDMDMTKQWKLNAANGTRKYFGHV